MKLQKLRYLMIGIGFFEVFVATLIGSLVGAKINAMLAHDSSNVWVFGLQKMLLVSVHSHMNLMAIVTILIGLVLGLIWGQVSDKLIKFCILCNIIAMPFFVTGLLLKALSEDKNSLLFGAMMSFGAILYMISIGLFASLFLFLFSQSRTNENERS